MHNYRREQTDQRSLQVNQGITEDTVDDLIYRPRFPATALFPDAASGAALAVGMSSAFIIYPNVGFPAARAADIPPAQWVRGNLSGVQLVWSGDTASTNPVSWQVNGMATKEGAAAAGAAFVGPVLLAGPATIGFLIRSTIPASSLVPIDSSHVLYGFNVFRNAAAVGDTYAGVAWLYSIRLIYTPSQGH